MSLKTHISEIYKIRHCNIADQELLLRFSGLARGGRPALRPRHARATPTQQDAGGKPRRQEAVGRDVPPPARAS